MKSSVISPRCSSMVTMVPVDSRSIEPTRLWELLLIPWYWPPQRVFQTCISMPWRRS